MLHDGTVAAERAGAGEPGEALLTAFLRSTAPLLRRLPGDPDAQLGELYELAARPAPGTTATASVGASAPSAPERVTIEATLEELLADARTGGPLERSLSIVAPAGGTLEPIPLPAPRRRAGPPAEPALVADATRLTTAWQAVRPTSAPAASAHALIASDLARPLDGRLEAFAVADGTISLAGAAAAADLSGPMLDDAAAVLMPDRVNPAKLWYAPSYALAAPDPATATPGATPYLFRFRTVGHDAQGRPFVEATVRLTVARGMPEAVRAEWEARGRPELTPVAASGPSFELHVPYRDETAETRMQPIPAARITDLGDRAEVEFDLLDRWARVAYGALSTPGFQASPANVSVAYVFAGWRSVLVPWRLPGTVLRVPALERARGSQDAQIRFGGGVLSLRPAADGDGGFEIPPIRPRPETLPDLEDMPERRRYLRRNQAHADQLDVLMPCASLGSLYVQEVEGEVRAVGCQDAFSLGEAPRKVYEEIPVAAAGPGTRVLRALTTPGRFAIVPRDFQIGRYEPTEGERAYRPTMMLLSTIDVATPANTKCVFVAGLEPDLPADERAAIERELRRQYHPAPVVDLVTELPGTAAVTWALPTGSGTGWTVTDETVRTTEGFAVTLTTDAAGVQAVQRILVSTGIRGAATFTLGDGETFTSNVNLRLDRIVGPASTGPVAVAVAGATATLRNMVEAPVTVSELFAGPDGTPVPVDATIAPAATLDLAVPAGTASAVARCTVQSTPASLQEVRAYVEDITFEVRFLNVVDLASHGLTGLDVVAHIAGDAHEERVALRPGTPDAAMTFVSPLTQFATDRVLEFRVDRLGEGGAVLGSTETVSWPLDTKGHLVSLTPELVLGTAGPQ